VKIKRIYYTSRFEKRFKKLPNRIKKLAIKKEKLFRTDFTSPMLKTHALSGELKGFYSFSVNYHYRIMFKFEKTDEVTFIDVGTHSIYR
jgi:addiction module RelE/StbE family toxin